MQRGGGGVEQSGNKWWCLVPRSESQSNKIFVQPACRKCVPQGCKHVLKHQDLRVHWCHWRNNDSSNNDMTVIMSVNYALLQVFRLEFCARLFQA